MPQTQVYNKSKNRSIGNVFHPIKRCAESSKSRSVSTQTENRSNRGSLAEANFLIGTC